MLRIFFEICIRNRVRAATRMGMGLGGKNI